MFTIKAPTFPEPPGDWYCDFCGDRQDPKDIVVAPNKAAICEPCIQKSAATLARARAEAGETVSVSLTRLPDGRAVLDIVATSKLLSADTVAALVKMFSRLPVIEKAGA